MNAAGPRIRILISHYRYERVCPAYKLKHLACLFEKGVHKMKKFYRSDWSPVQGSGVIFLRLARVLLILILTLSLFACATPIGVNKMEMREAYMNIHANALSADLVSSDTKIVMKRYDLLDRFEKDATAVISLLHEKACKDTRRDILFALAELSFLNGERLK